ncbi:Potassium voltage-gated channel subfamily H member 8 [Frankliniella fusca]|uniref:Potassium voltage-gated channel subfamily H member 8 n=1 Tax=Frankliniella fusca TaxID=407009 RepID=A0AAE1GV51_9NEOP|nr:Potassium voltage-gated channel subfamily H member 8 [Frankliniella fusca]
MKYSPHRKDALRSDRTRRKLRDGLQGHGARFWCLLDIVPIKNEKREVVLFLASHKDITHSKEGPQQTSDDEDEDYENDANGNLDPEAPPANYERRRSRAVLYQLSGHYKQDKIKSKIKLNNTLLQPNSAPLPEYKTTALKKSRFVLSHYGAFKSCWDWLILLATFYVAIIVPYNASFVNPDRPSMVSDVVVEALFMMDIAFNFRTTYVSRKGEVVSHPKCIAINYLKGWFVVDLLAALPFDLLYASDVYSGEESGHGQIHLLKLTRLLRLARLLQKMDRYSQYSAMILTMLMFFFTLLAHWLACVWFVIAERERAVNRKEWDLGWIHTLADRLKLSVANVSHSESYITALYFTCSSLTSVGFGNVSANTYAEKTFSIVTMLVGALMHAAVFGNVTAIIQRMYSRRSLYQTKWRDLKDFLALHQVPKELKRRMEDYFQTMWSLNHGLDIHETLKEFPEELRGDVCLHLHREILQLPIFETASPGCLKLLSLHIRSNFCAPGEYLIHRGDALAYIYYLCHGSMEVVQDNMVVAILGKGDLVGSDINVFLQSSNGTAGGGGGGGGGCAGGGGGGGGGGTAPIDVLIKSSCDVRALTYCDLKCLHIVGLVDVLRLYPEYQSQFANDIQHDLTYNLREGYEAEQESEGNGGPSLTLPSISEDDENLGEDGPEELSPLSPMHALYASPGRHAKFQSRLEELRYTEGGRSRRAGERPRGVVGGADARSSVERLDNHVSSLHQDVATLSQEVRSAIQALQELASSTAARPVCYPHSLPARSNPNLPVGHPHAHAHAAMGIGLPGQLHRSSSHPPDMFSWEDGVHLHDGQAPAGAHPHAHAHGSVPPGHIRPLSPPPFPPRPMPAAPLLHPVPLQDRATQTDYPADLLEQFVLENPQRVLSLLGVETGAPPLPMLPRALPPPPPPPPPPRRAQDTELVYTMPSAYSVRRLATSVEELARAAGGGGGGGGGGSKRLSMPSSRSLQTFFFPKKEQWS